MAYYVVVPSANANPLQEDYYEYVDGEFIPTEDTSVDSEKDYYEYIEGSADFVEYEIQNGDNPSLLGLYVLVDGEYVATSDTSPGSGTVYYMFVSSLDESLVYFEVDEASVHNPKQQGLYVDVNGQYLLSEDTTPSEDTVYYRPVSDDDTEYDMSSIDDYAEDYPEERPYDLEELMPTRYTVTDPTGKTQHRLDSVLFAYANDGDDPSALGWLERVGDTDYGILTDDTVVQEGKPYYILVTYSEYVEEDVTTLPSNFNPSLASSNYYVYNSQTGEYTLTSDTRVVSGRKYYRSKADDDEALYMPDPLIGLEILYEDDL